MDPVTETWRVVPRRQACPTDRQACLVHIYPTGPGMGARYPLSDAPPPLPAADALSFSESAMPSDSYSYSDARAYAFEFQRLPDGSRQRLPHRD